MNDAASELFNQQMGELDYEYSKLLNAGKKGFTLDTILMIYILIMIMVIGLSHH